MRAPPRLMYSLRVARVMLRPLLALQLGILNTPLGRVLAALLVIGVVILVGRLVLRVAWRLVTIAAIIVAILFLASIFLP